MWFGELFLTEKREGMLISYNVAACHTMSSTNSSLSISFLFFFQVNYIPLCSKSSIFPTSKSILHFVYLCEYISNFENKRDFEWSITVSVLHFKAVGNERSGSGSSSSSQSQCDWRKEFPLNHDNEIQRVYTVQLHTFHFDWNLTRSTLIYCCMIDSYQLSPCRATCQSLVYGRTLIHSRKLIQRIVSLCFCLCFSIEHINITVI